DDPRCGLLIYGAPAIDASAAEHDFLRFLDLKLSKIGCLDPGCFFLGFGFKKEINAGGNGESRANHGSQCLNHDAVKGSSRGFRGVHVNSHCILGLAVLSYLLAITLVAIVSAAGGVFL